MLCVSGLANFDLIYSNRTGHLAEGPPPGSFHGLGVRPLFGLADNNIFGSINNINLLFDGGINNWVNMHLDLAYVNGSRRTVSYSFNDSDWSTVYNRAAAIKVNQAYALFANPAVTPFFVQIGRFNAPFGDYQAFPITPSLTQLISQVRTGGVTAGAILPNGLYAEASWNMARQSTENANDIYIVYNGLSNIPGFGGTPIRINNKDRNYGGKIGFRGKLFHGQLYANVNASYIADIRDSDYFAAGWDQYNLEIKQYPLFGDTIRNRFVYMQRAHAIALHANFAYKFFGLGGDYVTALEPLNPADPKHSKIWAYALDASVKFPIFHHMPSKFTIGFQQAGDANIYALLAPFTAPQLAPLFPPFLVGNVLPHYRYIATYQVHVLPWVMAAVQWVHDQDFSPSDGGSNKSSDFGIIRLGFQL